MESGFEKYHCIYWVFTQLCNDTCGHCYNDSGPFGKRMSEKDCIAIIENLPAGLEQLILSGGEPLADKKLLFAILDRIAEKYVNGIFLTLQFNGDLLTENVLDTLLAKGIKRFSIASIDRYHKKQGQRMAELSALFESRNIHFLQGQPSITKSAKISANAIPRTYGFFGATEDMWLGGNWARGRALENDIWKRDGVHNFCAIHSGARGFLGHENQEVLQELSIQLWKISPCCAGTHFPMGDARKEKVSTVLERASRNTVFRILNAGDPFRMGESFGISVQEARDKSMELENICLYCDHFMKCHKKELFDANGVLATD